jgi:phosphinothricin acetyltransferase
VALTVRPARPGDGAGISAVLAPIVRDTAITFTTRPRPPCEIDAAIAAGQPHWVAERGRTVVGFATFAPFRPGPGYAHAFEPTLHLRKDARRQGAGRALLAALEAGAVAAGGHCLIAVIAGDNDAAIAFHARFGFVCVGRLPGIGWKFGRRHDAVLMQKDLPSRPAAG